MSLVLHILWYKFRVVLKMATEFKAQNIVKNLASTLVFGGFAIAAFVFARMLTAYVLETIHMGVFLLHRFLSMILYVFFLSINIGNIIVSYAALYRSKETSYFLTKPVGFGSLFAIKFLDTFFYSSTTLFVVALAVLAGYGSYFHFGILFYLSALFLWFIPFMLLSASLGVIALLLLMRIAKIVGIRLLFVIIVIGYVGSIYAYFTLTNPVALVTGVMKFFPYVDNYYGFLDAPGSKLMPSHWVADALYWTLEGNLRLAAINTSYLLVISATAVAAMLLMGKMMYYETWLISMDMRAFQEARSAKSRFFGFAAKPHLLDSQTSVMLKKEFWQFFREPSQWIHLGIISMLVIIFVGSIRNVNLRMEQPFLQSISYLVIYIFISFLLSSIALRFVYPLVSTEGPAFWMMRSSPVTTNKIYWLKLFFVAVPMAFIGELLIVTSHQPFRIYTTLITVAFGSLFPVMVAFMAMNLGLGAFFSNFRESNAIKIASSQGATLTFLLTVVLLVFLVAIIFIPLNAYFTAVMAHQPPPRSGLYLAMWIIIALSALVTGISTLIGLKALRRDL